MTVQQVDPEECMVVVRSCRDITATRTPLATGTPMVMWRFASMAAMKMNTPGKALGTFVPRCGRQGPHGPELVGRLAFMVFNTVETAQNRGPSRPVTLAPRVAAAETLRASV